MLAAAAVLFCRTKVRFESGELASFVCRGEVGKKVRKTMPPNGIEKKGKVDKRSVLMIAKAFSSA